ncbi:MAG: hypothetical protein EZS28_023975 [Streblomastix strix]|uniref:SPRY domain-containing protein n=1 Tax=Streblomastix strix TaxID=222440 RepID=A0A5J4VD83_9EUKA|nr:MAG: hypothetical protein EZS28_023975 [Streblomastix strix]
MKQANERALNERDCVIEERNGLQRDNEIVLTERDGERQEKERAQVERDQEKRRAGLAVSEKDRLQVELNKANTENDRLQVELNRANTEKDRLQVELDRERQEKDRIQHEFNRSNTEKDQEKRRAIIAEEEKQKAQSERDQEKRRADTEHDEVIRLTAEVLRLNQSLLQVTSSPQPITVNLQVPTGMSGHKEQNIFKHDNTNAACTITSDPIISDGIVYYESVFEKHDGPYGFGIGIADSTVVFKPNKQAWEDINKTVYYRNEGQLQHIFGGPSNQGFFCGQRIGAEVNMSSSPRKLTFFIDDVEQQYYVINIPQAIRFWSLIKEPNSSFIVTRFERRSSSSAHGVTGS